MGVGIVGIVITLVSVGFALVVTAGSLFLAWKIFSGFNKSMQESSQLLATGQPGQGRIVSVRDLGGSIRFGGQLPQQRLQIDLDVSPSNGQQQFRASITQLVSLHMARLAPGAVVEVRYDPTNPMRVAIVL